MKILVVCPMYEEYKKFKNALKGWDRELKHKYSVYECGVGETSSAAFVGAELTKGYDLVALVGFAAGTPNFSQGEWVMPNVVRYYRFNDLMQKILPSNKFPYKLKTVGPDECVCFSSDYFVDAETSLSVRNKFSADKAIFDMESLGVAVASQMFRVPLIVIRQISDVPESGSEKDFTTFVDSCGDFYIPLAFLETYLNV